jgi:CheY-like chemotaxis protein
MRVLVVEDDPDGQEVVSRILRYHRIAHDVAADGETAIELLGQNTYAVLVIDLALPNIDGWQLLNVVRTSPLSHVPCIAVTAFHSAEVAVEAIRAGFAAYFPKPLEATSFVRELMRVIVPG